MANSTKKSNKTITSTKRDQLINRFNKNKKKGDITRLARNSDLSICFVSNVLRGTRNLNNPNLIKSMETFKF